MAKKEEPREGKPKQCYVCGKDITVHDEEPVYIKTKRKTELWIHQKCMPGRK